MSHFLGLGEETPSPEHTTQMKVNSTITVALVVVGGVLVAIAFGVGERRPEKQGCTKSCNRIGSPQSLPVAACWRMGQ